MSDSTTLQKKWRHLTAEEKQEIREIDDGDQDLDEDEYIPWHELDLDKKAIVVAGNVTHDEFAQIHAEVFG